MEGGDHHTLISECNIKFDDNMHTETQAHALELEGMCLDVTTHKVKSLSISAYLVSCTSITLND